MGGGAVSRTRKRSAASPEAVTGASAAAERELCQARLVARFDGGPVSEPNGRLAELGAMFGLSAFESNLVAALWTSAYDPAWRGVLCQRGAYEDHLSVLGLSRAFGHAPQVRLASE